MDMRNAVLALVLSPAVALAATPQPGTAAKDAATAAAGNEQKTCKMERDVGSQRMKRVCMTEAERLVAKEKADRALNPGARCASQETYCNGGL